MSFSFSFPFSLQSTIKGIVNSSNPPDNWTRYKLENKLVFPCFNLRVFFILGIPDNLQEAKQGSGVTRIFLSSSVSFCVWALKKFQKWTQTVTFHPPTTMKSFSRHYITITRHLWSAIDLLRIELEFLSVILLFWIEHATVTGDSSSGG